MSKVLLIQPPYSDFTYPYHSISYVSSSFEKLGFSVECIDLNIVWLRYLLTKDKITQWSKIIEGRLDLYEKQHSLNAEEQLDFAHLISVKGYLEEICVDTIVKTLKNENSYFYNYTEYLEAKRMYNLFEKCLSYFYRPFSFNKFFEIPPFYANSDELINLSLLNTEFMSDILILLNERYDLDQFDIVGITVPFNSNLPFALSCSKVIRDNFSNVKTILGGTAIYDIYKNATDINILGKFSILSDYFFLGESENGLEDTAKYILGESCKNPLNLIDLGNIKYKYKVLIPDLGQRERPNYDWIDWSLYLSPSRQINYSPTRGCYWGKCSFCDYGFNENAATAPYRNDKIDIVINDLKRISSMGIEYVYFAVDAISLPFLKRISQRVIEESISVKISAEIKLEKILNKETVDLFEKAGIVTFSFGFESASDKILKKINKGISSKVLDDCVKSFKDSKIGIQPKYFFGFPSENDYDRKLTVDYLKNNRDVFSIVTNWNVFSLTSNSEVAKSYKNFGIKKVARKENDDIGGALDYCLENGEPAPNAFSYTSFNEQLAYPDEYERPWAGGIDTLHTLLYMEKFGRDVFHTLKAEARVFSESNWSRYRVKSSFDIEELFQNVALTEVLKQGTCGANRVETYFSADELEELKYLSSKALKSSEKQYYYDIDLK